MRRWWALLLVAVTVLASCGGDVTRRREASSERRAVATSAPPTRAVTHALGQTTIPGQPQRIVVLNQYSLLDYLLAVDIKPVGSTGDAAADCPFGVWLCSRTAGVEMVGDTEEPDLERIAALKPDLILSNPWQEDIYPKLGQIAPTVAVPLDYADTAARQSYEQHPLWGQLRAAKAGNVRVVDSFLWAGGVILWADAVLAEVSRHLVGG